MYNLTDRQRECLLFIKTYKDSHGYAPSMREIGKHMGIRSSNGVNDHLQALERKGAIKRSNDGTARSITLPGDVGGTPEGAELALATSSRVVSLQNAAEAAKRLIEAETGSIPLGGERLRVYNMLAIALG